MAADPVTGAPTGMRKSCQFCRSRKIRCSGDRICAACRMRSIDCVYGREGSKGRPRGSTRNSSGASTPRKQSPAGSDESEPPSLASSDSESGPLRMPSKGTVGHELEAIFKRKFAQAPAFGQNHAQDHFFTKDTSMTDVPASAPITPTQDAPPQVSTTVTYEELYAGIKYGLVKLISTLFGSLGCSSYHESITRFIANKLATDDTTSMFDQQSRPLPPLPKTDHEQQMIEIWFVHHPLSHLVSKTTLLHKLRNGAVDHTLLATVLADAHFALSGQSLQTGQDLFIWAAESLRSQRLAGAPLSTIQSLILLGWHHLACGSARRGYCYLELARVLIFEMQERMQASSPTPVEHINGVSIAKVELELVQRMYWFTFAMELWAALQLGVPLCEAMPQGTSIGFPPFESSFSAVFALDRESGNIATLKIQERQLRQLWPLAHLASTLAPIYALYPRAATQPGAPHGDWEDLTLMRLRKLLSSRGHLASICQDVYNILAEGLVALESKTGATKPYLDMLAAYRAVLIHLVFPCTGSADVYAGLGPETLDVAIRDMQQFKQLLSLAENVPAPELEIVDASRPANPDLFLLGIDTCGRALVRISDGWTLGPPQFGNAVHARHAELLELAEWLHRVCKHPKLQVVPGVRMVKKRLKAVKLRFQGVDTPASSDSNGNTGLWLPSALPLNAMGAMGAMDGTMPMCDFTSTFEMEPSIDWFRSSADNADHMKAITLHDM